MIIADLSGGLGNQMFQYACARSLSIDLSLPLKVIYGSSITQTVHNGYELKRVFGIDLDFASKNDINKSFGCLLSNNFFRKVLSKKPFNAFLTKKFIVEQSFQYSPIKHCDMAFIQGYWQSEKYFENNKLTILSDFCFQDSDDPFNYIMEKEIKSTNSVSVHIRRGDYLTNLKAKSIHGHCSLNYYLDAIAFLQSKIGDFRMFIFSDDPDWASDNLGSRFSNVTIVRHNSGEKSYNDMKLMSLCDHHIIANSTFSWWGAWLNPSSEKIVVAPKNWFVTDKISSEDLIPSSWILI
jgi:hypothetical protein